MTHSFNTEIATKYGLEEAILLENIYFWTEKNRANEKHFHDGRYWTYNSTKAFHSQFPYIPERTLKRKLENMISKGLILTANFNENKYDRTLWYALTDLAQSIMPKCQMDNVNMANGDSQNGEPIPDNKPIKYQEVIDIYHQLCPSFPKCKTLSEKRKSHIRARLSTYSIEDFKEVFNNAENSDFLKGKVNNFKADFDWLMNDNNFAKVLEAKYNDKTPLKSKKEYIVDENGVFSLERK